MYVTRAHIRAYGATRVSRMQGLQTGRSMPRNNECRLRVVKRMEHDEEGREGLKGEQQRLDRHPERELSRGALKKTQPSNVPRRNTSESSSRSRTTTVQEGVRQTER